MASGERQMGRDQRSGTQVATGGFYLTNGLPRPTAGFGDFNTVVFAKKQTGLIGRRRLGRAISMRRMG
ncbi:hypothetical protein D3C78_1902940 [compost metagenome]